MNQTLHWPIRITFVLYSRIRCSCFSWMKQVLLFCKILQGALHCGMSAALILVFLQACLQCVLWPILTSCVMCSVNTDEIHFYEWVHTVSLSHSFTAGMDFLNHLSISHKMTAEELKPKESSWAQEADRTVWVCYWWTWTRCTKVWFSSCFNISSLTFSREKLEEWRLCPPQNYSVWGNFPDRMRMCF